MPADHRRMLASRIAALPLLGLSLTLGCGRDAPAEPYRTAGPAPDGVTATLTRVQSRTAAFPQPTLNVVGDSLVATARLSVSGCSDYTAQAGWEGTTLVVTVLDRLTNRTCTLPVAYADFRVAARTPVRGRRLVVLRSRFEDSSPNARERELARRTVTLP